MDSKQFYQLLSLEKKNNLDTWVLLFKFFPVLRKKKKKMQQLRIRVFLCRKCSERALLFQHIGLKVVGNIFSIKLLKFYIVEGW